MADLNYDSDAKDSVNSDLELGTSFMLFLYKCINLLSLLSSISIIISINIIIMIYYHQHQLHHYHD